MTLRVLIIALFCLVGLSVQAQSILECRRTFGGSLDIAVTHALDGDTVEAVILIPLPSPFVVTSRGLGSGLKTGDRIRIANIDTPERSSDCTAERAKAEEARSALLERVDRAGQTRLVDIECRRDRYNRILARIEVDGEDLGEWLVRQGLARPWGGAREGWCDIDGNYAY